MPRIIVKGETFFNWFYLGDFLKKFSGDDFNVYRALRSINPSPYLFYFDYGGYKIFGSSPEAQLVIKEKLAEIHPIAGTFKRTGNETEDKILAEKFGITYGIQRMFNVYGPGQDLSNLKQGMVSIYLAQAIKKNA